MDTLGGTVSSCRNGKPGSRQRRSAWQVRVLGGCVLVLWAVLPARGGVTSTTAAAAPQTRKPDPAGVDEIVSMVKAGISNEVIKTYIETSSIPYSLSAADIIAMRDKGVPADIITAVLERGEELRAQPVGAAPQSPPTPAAPTPNYEPPPGNSASYPDNPAVPVYAAAPGYGYSGWWSAYAYWPFVYYYPYVYPDYTHGRLDGGKHRHRGSGPPAGNPPAGPSSPWQPVVTGRRGGSQSPPSGSTYPINPVARPFNDVPQTIGGARVMTFNNVPQTVQPAARTANQVARPFNHVPQTVGARTMRFNDVPQALQPAPRLVNPVRPAINPAPRVIANPPRYAAPVSFAMPSRITASRTVTVGARPMGRAR